MDSRLYQYCCLQLILQFSTPWKYLQQNLSIFLLHSIMEKSIWALFITNLLLGGCLSHRIWKKPGSLALCVAGPIAYGLIRPHSATHNGPVGLVCVLDSNTCRLETLNLIPIRWTSSGVSLRAKNRNRLTSKLDRFNFNLLFNIQAVSKN